MSPRLLSLLREQTQPAGRELGVLIDCQTAEVLQMVRGTQSRVTFDSRILNSVESVAAIHTHNEDVAFSAVDWDSFIASNTIMVEVVVSPSNIYTLRKGADYDPLPPTLGTESAEQHWNRLFDEAVVSIQRNPHVLNSFHSQPAMEQFIIENISVEMAKLFRVDYEKIDIQSRHLSSDPESY